MESVSPEMLQAGVVKGLIGGWGRRGGVLKGDSPKEGADVALWCV